MCIKRFCRLAARAGRRMTIAVPFAVALFATQTVELPLAPRLAELLSWRPTVRPTLLLTAAAYAA